MTYGIIGDLAEKSGARGISMPIERSWIGAKSRSEAMKRIRKEAKRDGKTVTNIRMKMVKSSKNQTYQRFFVVAKTRRRK